MAKWTRREFIGGASALAASAAMLPRVAKASRAPIDNKRPRAIIHIFMPGGMDAILSTDPKVRSEVEPKTDIGYEEREIVQHPNGARTGPLFKLLERYVPRMAIVNGIVSSTVAHQTGRKQIIEMRRAYPPTAVGLSGTIGRLRLDDRPCPDIRLVPGTLNEGQRGLRADDGSLVCPEWQPQLSWLSKLAHADAHRDAILGALRTRLAAEPGTIKPTQMMISLIERLKSLPPVPEATKIEIPPPKVRAKAALKGAENWSNVVRDVIYALRHRLTPAIYISHPFPTWDTHVENWLGQFSVMDVFGSAVAVLIDELDRTKSPDGNPLSDEVLLVCTSELGRFPYLNEFNGKDHFPQHPFFMIGKGIRPGWYGSTNHQMMSQPISLQTGKPSSSASDIVPTLDDVGTTLLHIFGIEDTESVGYLGRRLDFLIA